MGRHSNITMPTESIYVLSTEPLVSDQFLQAGKVNMELKNPKCGMPRIQIIKMSERYIFPSYYPFLLKDVASCGEPRRFTIKMINDGKVLQGWKPSQKACNPRWEVMKKSLESFMQNRETSENIGKMYNEKVVSILSWDQFHSGFTGNGSRNSFIPQIKKEIFEIKLSVKQVLERPLKSSHILQHHFMAIKIKKVMKFKNGESLLMHIVSSYIKEIADLNTKTKMEIIKRVITIESLKKEIQSKIEPLEKKTNDLKVEIVSVKQELDKSEAGIRTERDDLANMKCNFEQLLESEKETQATAFESLKDRLSVDKEKQGYYKERLRTRVFGKKKIAEKLKIVETKIARNTTVINSAKAKTSFDGDRLNHIWFKEHDELKTDNNDCEQVGAGHNDESIRYSNISDEISNLLEDDQPISITLHSRETILNFLNKKHPMKIFKAMVKDNVTALKNKMKKEKKNFSKNISQINDKIETQLNSLQKEVSNLQDSLLKSKNILYDRLEQLETLRGEMSEVKTLANKYRVNEETQYFANMKHHRDFFEYYTDGKNLFEEKLRQTRIFGKKKIRKTIQMAADEISLTKTILSYLKTVHLNRMEHLHRLNGM